MTSNWKEYKFSEVTINLDKQRIPLSASNIHRTIL